MPNRENMASDRAMELNSKDLNYDCRVFGKIRLDEGTIFNPPFASKMGCTSDSFTVTDKNPRQNRRTN